MKIENPTAWLATLLTRCDPLNPKRGLLDMPTVLQARWEDLHAHIVSGGALPEQWRGPGTEVGALIEELGDSADDPHELMPYVAAVEGA